MGSITQFPKGSLWRMWDLQVHTPGTKLSDSYPKTDDKWEKFIKVLKESNVAVFGLTDYFSIDGYLTFIEKAKEIDPEILISKVFFPNIEFRLDSKTNIESEEIHLHLIFNNIEEVVRRLPTFFAKLELIQKRDPQSHFTCTKDDVEHDDVGYKKAMVSMASVDKALLDVFGQEKCYFKIVVVSGTGSNRAPDKASLRTRSLHDEIDVFSDAFFGNADSTDYYLDVNRLDNKRKTIRPKPVFSTSDCHSIEDCSNFIGKKFVREGVVEKEPTWVKADTTFEGLRQTLFEPASRVKIQTEEPEVKKPYLVLDSFKFLDNSGKNIFQSEDIDLNPSLNVIIGGRSTGKSLLLYFASKTIDRDEVDRRFEDVPPLPKYEQEMLNEMKSSDFNFEVHWKDGAIDRFLEPKEEHRKILYIPQNYLSSLSGTGQEKKDALNDFIFDVIMQDEAVKLEYNKRTNHTRLLKEQIDISISEYFSLKGEVENKKKKIEEMGDLVGIDKFVKQVKAKIEELKKDSSLTKTQAAKLKELVTNRSELKKELGEIKQDEDSVDTLFDGMNQHFTEVEELLSEKLGYVLDNEIKSLIAGKTEWVSKLNPLVVKAKNEITTKIEVRKKKTQESLDKIEEELKPLVALVKKQQEIERLMDVQKNEEERMNKIISLRNLVKMDLKKLDGIRKHCLDLYLEIHKTYKELQAVLKKAQPGLGDVILNIKINFRDKDFNEHYIQSYINRIDLKRMLGETDDKFYYEYDETTHFEKLAKITYALMTGGVKPLNFRSSEEATHNLLSDYWGLDFSVTYEGDTLENMSPGKMSLTLLKLLILLRNDNYPILIDQPEADLDNRSVYTELVKYIEEKKVERQIILVTHNPNLVVGADAELVVVANQGRNDNELYQFEYVTGSLENTAPKDAGKKAVLFRQGIREHICEILEGGREAFKKREEKYNFPE